MKAMTARFTGITARVSGPMIRNSPRTASTVPAAEHRPGQHDVLAEHVLPAADGAHHVGPVDAERALRDERPLQKRLLAFDRRDREVVVEVLEPREEARAPVSDLDAARDGGR